MPGERDEHLCAQSQPTCIGRNGGYADKIRVNSRFAIPVPKVLDSENVAPLLCGGITVYSPLRDPIVMRLLAGAIAVGVGAVALSFALAALAAAEMALGLLLGVLLLIWLMTSGKGSGGKSVNNITIHNTNKSRRWR